MVPAALFDANDAAQTEVAIVSGVTSVEIGVEIICPTAPVAIDADREAAADPVTLAIPEAAALADKTAVAVPDMLTVPEAEAEADRDAVAVPDAEAIAAPDAEASKDADAAPSMLMPCAPVALAVAVTRADVNEDIAPGL